MVRTWTSSWSTGLYYPTWVCNLYVHNEPACDTSDMHPKHTELAACS